MDCSSMTLFLSEENIKLHKEYLNKQKLRYSILKKSCATPLASDIKEIYRNAMPKDVKKEALELLCDIKSHELFFNSFIYPTKICNNIKKYYTSQESLVYDVLLKARERNFGFLYLCLDTRGKPRLEYGNNEVDIFIKYDPILAFDLWEHVYIRDYGFNREKFLRCALEYFNLKLLDDRLKSIDN